MIEFLKRYPSPDAPFRQKPRRLFLVRSLTFVIFVCQPFSNGQAVDSIGFCRFISSPSPDSNMTSVIRGQLFTDGVRLIMASESCPSSSHIQQANWTTALLLQSTESSQADFDGVLKTVIESRSGNRDDDVWATVSGKLNSSDSGTATQPSAGRSIEGQSEDESALASFLVEQIGSLSVDSTVEYGNSRALSICKVIDGIHQYNDQIIAIEGDYWQTGHGAYLADICPETGLIDGRQIPSVIQLVNTQPSYLNENIASEFGIGAYRPRIQLASQDIERAVGGRCHITRRVTVLGRLLAAKPGIAPICDPEHPNPERVAPGRVIVHDLIRWDITSLPEQDPNYDLEDAWLSICPRPERATAAQCAAMTDEFDLVRGGCEDQIEARLHSGSLDLNARGSSNLAGDVTLLMEAIRYDRRALIDVLARAGANVNARTKSGGTPLCFGAQRSDADVVGKLIRFGAHVNPTVDGECASLVAAAANGDVPTLAVLINAGANLSVSENSWNKSPLGAAAKHNRVQNFRYLLSEGAPARSTTDADMPWFEEYSYPVVEIVRMLIDAGVAVDATNRDGQTALMAYAREGDVAQMRALLNAGADVNHQDRNGSTALMAAVESGCVDAVDLLLQKGADPSMVNSLGANVRMIASQLNASTFLLDSLQRANAGR